MDLWENKRYLEANLVVRGEDRALSYNILHGLSSRRWRIWASVRCSSESPSGDDLNKNVEELSAKKAEESCHGQTPTSTTRKHFERNILNISPVVAEAEHLSHQMSLAPGWEDNYKILKKAEHQWPRPKYKYIETPEEQLKFLQILSHCTKWTFGQDTNKQKKTVPPEVLLPDCSVKLQRFALSSVLRDASYPSCKGKTKKAR